MKEVDDLVERTAILINKVPKDGYSYGKDVAKQILSDPDLALIDRRNYNAFNKAEVPKGSTLAMILPLAEALKESK